MLDVRIACMLVERVTCMLDVRMACIFDVHMVCIFDGHVVCIFDDRISTIQKNILPLGCGFNKNQNDFVGLILMPKRKSNCCCRTRVHKIFMN